MIDFIIETLKKDAKNMREIADDHRANAEQYALAGEADTLVQAAKRCAKEYDEKSAQLTKAAEWLKNVSEV